MSKAALSGKMLAIALATLSSVVPLGRAQAQTVFGEAEINPESMAAIAVPLSNGGYNLLVVEQLERKTAKNVGPKVAQIRPALIPCC